MGFVNLAHQLKYNRIQSHKINQSSFADQQKKTWLTVGQKDQPVFIMLILSLFLLGAISLRLGYLQIIEGDKYLAKADHNRTKTIPKPPVRGNLFDRRGKVLAATQLSHSAYLWAKVQKKENWPEIKTMLANILNIAENDLQTKIEAEKYDSQTLIRISRNLTPAQITAIEEHRDLLGDVEVDVDTVRYYPHQQLGSHILGYTREINPQEYAELQSKGYRLGDVIGKMGVEYAFESQLRGEWGGILLEIDGSGKVLRKLGVKQALAGNDVTLTLDLELQKSAEQALGDRKGAVVALDPRDGSV